MTPGMRRALRAALSGRGRVSPNPLVGAAWTDGQRWITAHHAVFGGPHAEARLYPCLPPEPPGDLYLTLEPCTFRGKTPACIDLLRSRPPRRVFVATADPDPRVSGRGIAALQDAGIEVHIGDGARAAIRANLPFFSAHCRGRAWVELKFGTSLDGRVATESGESRWITGAAAREDVHRRRSWADAVVTGAGTIVADDPELTVRTVRGPEPTKIVLDSTFRTSPESRLWRAWMASMGRDPKDPVLRIQGNHGETAAGWMRCPRLIVVGGMGESRAVAFRERGWEVWTLPLVHGRVGLGPFLERAAQEGLHRLFVEAGPGLASSFLAAGLVDELRLYTAPSVIGGSHGWSGAFRAETLATAPRWELRQVRRFGDDLGLVLRVPGVVEEFLGCSPGWSRRRERSSP